MYLGDLLINRITGGMIDGFNETAHPDPVSDIVTMFREKEAKQYCIWRGGWTPKTLRLLHRR